jgi:hypothetical protein
MEKVKEIMEKLEEVMHSQFDKGIENVDTHEMGQVVDIYKDLSEAKYYCALVEAMEKAEYGMDYDYNGPKGYSTKYPDEFYRERDMEYPGKMYYTSSGSGRSGRGMSGSGGRSGGTNSSSRGGSGNGSSGGYNGGGYNGSGSEGMRRNYMESKEIHGRNSDEMENLEMYLNSMDSDMTELYPDMTMAEKQMTRNKLNAMLAKVK